MINILLEGYGIDGPWLYDGLKNYIRPNHSVAAVAFSFRDNRVKSSDFGKDFMSFDKLRHQNIWELDTWIKEQLLQNA